MPKKIEGKIDQNYRQARNKVNKVIIDLVDNNNDVEYRFKVDKKSGNVEEKSYVKKSLYQMNNVLKVKGCDVKEMKEKVHCIVDELLFTRDERENIIIH